VGFEVFTAVTTKNIDYYIFWYDYITYILQKRLQTCLDYSHTLKKAAWSYSETWLNFWEATLRHIQNTIPFVASGARTRQLTYKLFHNSEASARLRNVEWGERILICSEMIRIWKETIVGCFKMLSCHCSEGNATKNLCVAVNLIKIRTRYVTNVSLQQFSYNLARHVGHIPGISHTLWSCANNRTFLCLVFTLCESTIIFWRPLVCVLHH
jgi:hypothetical protein